ncbi:MAG: hypothetical protein ACR2K5_10515 [Pseudolabrys sp.]
MNGYIRLGSAAPARLRHLRLGGNQVGNESSLAMGRIAVLARIAV